MVRPEEACLQVTQLCGHFQTHQKRQGARRSNERATGMCVMLSGLELSKNSYKKQVVSSHLLPVVMGHDDSLSSFG
jgi:hypothetical protein